MRFGFPLGVIAVCGRFAFAADGTHVLQQFKLAMLPPGVSPRYNAAPGQDILTVRQNAAGERDAAFHRWGLIPSWAKDPSIGYKMINARSETLSERPSFRTAFRLRRCVIPATGFYEWRQIGGRKLPMYFYRLDGRLLGLAGLWEAWRSPDGNVIQSVTIITTEPNELVSPVHNRMPVILRDDRVDLWLDHSSFDEAALRACLQPFPAEAMAAHAVSPRMNSARYEAPNCIDPWDEAMEAEGAEA